MGKLNGKVAIITGASRGIGRATAKLFAGEGANVVIAARSDGGQTCADEIVANGGNALFVRTDLSKPKEIDNLVDVTMSQYGKVDILVNNAAADDPMNIRGIQDLTDEMYAKASMHDENGAWQMLFGLNTLPEYRKNGYAGELLHRAVEDARKQGRKGAVLTCKQRLVDYYAKFCFVDEGVTDKSVHGGVVWHQMRITF